jgi:rod shape-determining protein MreD
MYLLFNNYKNIINQILICFVLIVIQGFLPKIIITKDLILTCDLFFIYLTFLVLRKELHVVIITAFFLGLFQDFVIQPETIGLYAFIKIISVYFLSYLNRVKKLWSESSKILYILIIYFFHYFIYHYVFISDFSYLVIIYVFLESILNILIFIVSKRVLIIS